MDDQLRLQVMRRAGRMARVPLLPESGLRILEISRQPVDEVNIAELDGIISHSPSMASRVLRAANSPYYGTLQQITTIRQAIFTIGLQDLLSLLTVTSLMEKFEAGGELKELDARELQKHSIATAAAARAGTAFLRGMLSPAESHLAGLLHDIGKSVFIRYFPSDFDFCVRKAREEKLLLCEAETLVFGISHDELGGWLANEWKLPPLIVQCALHHHNPMGADESYRDAVALVSWANQFSIAQHFGDSGDPLNQRLPAKTPAADAPESDNPDIVEMVARQCESRLSEFLAGARAELGKIGNEADSGPNAARAIGSESLPDSRRVRVPLQSSSAAPRPGFLRKFLHFFQK